MIAPRIRTLGRGTLNSNFRGSDAASVLSGRSE
jgi:hypothetical protein